jgi:hypothetical protein
MDCNVPSRMSCSWTARTITHLEIYCQQVLVVKDMDSNIVQEKSAYEGHELQEINAVKAAISKTTSTDHKGSTTSLQGIRGYFI